MYIICDEWLLACPTLCDTMDCSPPGSSVHGILQARILEWVAIPFSRGYSRPWRDQTQVCCIAGRFFTVWATYFIYIYIYIYIYSIHLTSVQVSRGLFLRKWHPINDEKKTIMRKIWGTNTPGTKGKVEMWEDVCRVQGTERRFEQLKQIKQVGE